MCYLWGKGNPEIWNGLRLLGYEVLTCYGRSGMFIMTYWNMTRTGFFHHVSCTFLAVLVGRMVMFPFLENKVKESPSNKLEQVLHYSYYLCISCISINLLVVCRESVNLIGYITRRLSADSQLFLLPLHIRY